MRTAQSDIYYKVKLGRAVELKRLARAAVERDSSTGVCGLVHSQDCRNQPRMSNSGGGKGPK